MLTETILFLIACAICVKIFVTKISASLLRRKFPIVTNFYRYQELTRLEQKVLAGRKLRSKLEYYFPSGLPDEDLQERFKTLDWFLSQSKTNLMVKSPDNVLETWNINNKYQEFIDIFYHYHGFYPTLNEEYLVEDYEVNLSWDNYQNSIEWSQLAIMVWIVETGILDYFDNNYQYLEAKFIESQTSVQIIEAETIIEEDEQEHEINSSVVEEQEQEQEVQVSEAQTSEQYHEVKEDDIMEEQDEKQEQEQEQKARVSEAQSSEQYQEENTMVENEKAEEHHTEFKFESRTDSQESLVHIHQVTNKDFYLSENSEEPIEKKDVKTKGKLSLKKLVANLKNNKRYSSV